MSMIGNIENRLALLGGYENQYPGERDTIGLCRTFLTCRDSLPEEYSRGHITGSAWILNSARNKTVLTHHRKLNLWLQTGGHLEEGEEPREGAIREGMEETGLTSLRSIQKTLFDLDIHLIPARGDQPAHYHFDMRFLLEALGNESLVISRESRDLRWVDLEDVPQYNRSESVLRMVLKSAPYGGFDFPGEFPYNGHH